MSKIFGNYGAAKEVYGRAKSRMLEIFHRLGHAVEIFKMRFMLLKVPTHVNIPNNFIFDEKKAVNRGRVAPDGKYYSSTYELNWNDIPDAIKQEIKQFDSVLRLYFGGDYLILGLEGTLCYFQRGQSRIEPVYQYLEITAICLASLFSQNTLASELMLDHY